MTANIKMIKTDKETILLLSKLKGLHLLKGNKASHASIVKKLVFREAKRRGLVKEKN